MSSSLKLYLSANRPAEKTGNSMPARFTAPAPETPPADGAALVYAPAPQADRPAESGPANRPAGWWLSLKPVAEPERMG